MDIDVTKILTRAEIDRILYDMRRRIGISRSDSTLMTLIVFRLATCCGLRASEIGKIHMGDVRVGMSRPYIYIRKEIAKGGRSRRVPLWWDKGTLDDIELWKHYRREQERAKDADPFLRPAERGPKSPIQTSTRYLGRILVRARFIRACRCLGPVRQGELTTHSGRHSFASHMLAAGRTLPEVQQALGHRNISVTSVYLHIAVDDDGAVGKVFDKGDGDG